MEEQLPSPRYVYLDTRLYLYLSGVSSLRQFKVFIVHSRHNYRRYNTVQIKAQDYDCIMLVVKMIHSLALYSISLPRQLIAITPALWCRSSDARRRQSRTVLAAGINSELSRTIMSTLACASRRHKLFGSRVECDKVSDSSTVLCKKGGAIVTDTGLLVYQVRPKVGREAPLDEEDVLAVQGGRCDLPVSSCIYTRRIDNLA